MRTSRDLFMLLALGCVIAVLAWNYAAPIVAKHRRFVEAGGRFVVPLPQLQVM